jgi:hypothetical protein
MHTQQRVVQSSRARRAVRKPVAATRSSRKAGSRWRAAAVAASIGCAAASAHAEQSWFSIEAGIGASSAVKVGDGIWFNQGMTHNTSTQSIAGRAGIQLNVIDASPRSFIPGVRVHATYNYFGHWNWDAIAGEDAAADHSYGYNVKTQQCYNQNCGQFREFRSSGNIQAIALTVEPYWDLGRDWTVGIEGGPALYRAQWNATATALASSERFGPAGSVENFHHSPRLYLGVMLGASISKGPVSVRLNYIYSPDKFMQSGGDVPQGVKGVYMLTANYTW